MNRHALFSGLLALLMPLTTLTARANTPGEIEVGLDAGIDYGLVDDRDEDVVAIQLPVSSVRVGFMTSERASFEPSISFDLLDRGGSSLWVLDLGVAMLMNLRASNGGAEPYVRFQTAWSVLSGNGESMGQFGAGLGIGARYRRGSSWGTRLEGLVIRQFETDDVLGTWNLGLRFGLSAFID